MRADAVGLFWDDTPPPRVKAVKERERITPPEPTWLDPGYLPGLKQAKAWPFHTFTDQELTEAVLEQQPLFFDVECYPNYFLVSFLQHKTGRVLCFEMYEGHPLGIPKLRWVMGAFLTVGFNSLRYDCPMVALACAGMDTQTLYEATQAIIVHEQRGWQVLQRYGLQQPKWNTIDLIEVAPLEAGLKSYGGRANSPRMQDLPFLPGTTLTADQMLCVKYYNVAGDLTATQRLYEVLVPQLELRAKMSAEWGLDLRSKSDAQIAEAIISAEYTRHTGQRPQRAEVDAGGVVRYWAPHYLRYEGEQLQGLLQQITGADFRIAESGKVEMPDVMKKARIRLGRTIYKLGIGGLHSMEKGMTHYADEGHVLVDKDVTSYYPSIILGLGLYPPQLGKDFLTVYKGIVDQRVQAKKNGDKVTADSLKITINGSFGKFGNRHSILYSPQLLIQVTLTGQLCLLMLAERLEAAGISVVSGNTDGVVIKCPRHLQDTMQAITHQWERDTGMELEETRYAAYIARDVNNYIAIKEDGSTKEKGILVFADGKSARSLHKNPSGNVVIYAIRRWLLEGVPLRDTIDDHMVPADFLFVRKVSGGCVKVWGDGRTEYLGGNVRWYYGTDTGNMIYAKNGFLVADTEGAVPAMEMPQEMPQDLNREWYYQRAIKTLATMGIAY